MPIIATVIIPCRNEENFIGACLDSAVLQDYPKDCLEIFVVDGMSADKTRQIVNGYCRKYPFIKLLDNPKRFTPGAFNAGIKEAKGKYIIMMGAHAEYKSDYISKCIARIGESGADNVGGILVTKPSKNTAVAKAIVRALSSPFGAGGSFRMESPVPLEVDTVFGGCYKRDVFERIGFFDERMIRSQDMEFNIRLKKAGGKIFLFPDIVCGYFPKSNFREFTVHNFWDGFWAIYPFKIAGIALKPRHYVPLLFILLVAGLAVGAIFQPWSALFLAGILILYFSLSLIISARIAIKEANWRYLFLVPVAFAIRHFAYGAGSFYGIIKLAMPLKHGRTN